MRRCPSRLLKCRPKSCSVDDRHLIETPSRSICWNNSSTITPPICEVGSSASILLLIATNLAAWAWALYIFRDHRVLLGTALLAYSFGLRHAVDADHIGAVDNVIRKSMQEGKRPISVGFWFSVGHWTVVVLAALAIAATTTELASHFDALKDVRDIVGTLVSTLFLFAIAAMNVVILAGVWKTFRRVKRGGTFADQHP